MAIWVLDAAHGGEDYGFVGEKGRKESNIVLEAVLEAKKHLERNGEKVVLTRSEDKFLSINDRVEIANGYEKSNFVSFYMNYDINRDVKGVAIELVHDNYEERYLGQLIKSEISSDLRTLNGKDIKTKGNYSKIKGNAVIVYGEYLSNSEVEKEFNAKRYGYLVAKACLASVDKVLLLLPKSTPKKLQQRSYRVCVGYFNDYDSAMDKVLKLNSQGIKDAYVVPYEGI